MVLNKIDEIEITKGSKMSTASKVTLGICLTVSIGIIGCVHYNQQKERAQLHEGVLRDMQRQHMRKVQNVNLLQQQIDLTRKLTEERDRQILENSD